MTRKIKLPVQKSAEATSYDYQSIIHWGKTGGLSLLTDCRVRFSIGAPSESYGLPAGYTRWREAGDAMFGDQVEVRGAVEAEVYQVTFY